MDFESVSLIRIGVSYGLNMDCQSVLDLDIASPYRIYIFVICINFTEGKN